MDSRPKIALNLTRDEVLDRLARTMRDARDPDFAAAPPPAWATEAAETIWKFVEQQVAGSFDQRDRLLRAALRWLTWLEEPRPEVVQQWAERVRELSVGEEPHGQ